MKKGVIAGLILLAIVVLISPAIVGRLAEKSMDENLNWAAKESGELKVTSENFTRGWFSSEGQHRIEIQDGELLAAIQTMSGPMNSTDLPVLVVNTKLDHGLIPVSSMSRERGSLAPGLGSAVSTMVVEFPDGETVDVPGTIYSKVGLGGELLSNYILEEGTNSDDGKIASWGATNIEVETNPNSGEAAFNGSVGKLSIADGTEVVSLGSLTFEGEQKPTRYGISVGEVKLDLADLNVNVRGNNAGGMRSMSVEATTELDGDEVNADATMNIAMQGLPQLGDMSLDMVFELAGADAAAVGHMQQSLESMANPQDPMAVYATIEQDVLALFAGGFEMNFERFNVTLPQGTVTSRMLFSFAEEDPATFEWTSLLLNTEAQVDVSIPEALVDMIVQSQPNAAMAIGGGYLVKRGDAYEMNAEMKKGLLTINGAPIPIPFGALR